MAKPKSRVRRTKEWKRRSQAAIKGWVARKLKREILDKRRVENELQRIAVLPKRKRKRKSIPGLKTKVSKRIKELEAEVRELKKDRKKWVKDVPREMITEKGNIAKYYSTLRAESKSNKALLKKALRAAVSHEHLDEMIYKLAEIYSVSIREIYSFFYSP